MSIGQQLLTVREFDQMTFDRPTELVRGEVVELTQLTAAHGAVCASVVFFLWDWSRRGEQGVVLSSFTPVLVERDPDTVRGPDVAFIRRERLADGKVPSGTLIIAPDLTVEVLCPADRWSDVFDKIQEYLAAGVWEVWIVDPAKRSLSIHVAERSPIRLTESETLTRPELLPGFSCRVSELFADL